MMFMGFKGEGWESSFYHNVSATKRKTLKTTKTLMRYALL
jgi:hypothetical protein